MCIIITMQLSLVDVEQGGGGFIRVLPFSSHVPLIYYVSSHIQEKTGTLDTFLLVILIQHTSTTMVFTALRPAVVSRTGLSSMLMAQRGIATCEYWFYKGFGEITFMPEQRGNLVHD